MSEENNYLVGDICEFESSMCFEERERACQWSHQFSSEKNITSKSCKCRNKLTSSPVLCPGGWGAVVSINWWISKIFI